MNLFIDVVHSCIYVSHSLPKYELAGFVKKVSFESPCNQILEALCMQLGTE